MQFIAFEQDSGASIHGQGLSDSQADERQPAILNMAHHLISTFQPKHFILFYTKSKSDDIAYQDSSKLTTLSFNSSLGAELREESPEDSELVHGVKIKPEEMEISPTATPVAGIVGTGSCKLVNEDNLPSSRQTSAELLNAHHPGPGEPCRWTDLCTPQKK